MRVDPVACPPATHLSASWRNTCADGQPGNLVPLPEPGTLLDGWILGALLGMGAFGAVYRGFHRETGAAVAIKLFYPEEMPSEEEGVLSILHEAELQSRITHPGIVGVLDVGFAGGWHYLVLELVDGCSLAEHIARQGRLDADEAIQRLLPIVDALDVLHRSGVVHRDIKPGNILLDRDGGARLSDFGLATSRDAADRASGCRGTPTYLSPEQAEALPDIDQRSDLYSLGVTLYEAVTGRPPFTGRSSQQVIRQHLLTEPTPAHVLCPHVSVALSAILQRLLAKSREQRYQHASELCAALEDALSGDSTSPLARAAVPA